jgi:hypothetical protein
MQQYARIAVAASFVATLCLGVAPAANAQTGCSTAAAAGTWGYTYIGTIYLPSGAALVAAVGTYTQDAQGHVTGRQTRNLGGSTGEEILRGRIRVQPDCTGKAVIRVYQGGTLQRTGYLNMVFVNSMHQSRWLYDTLALPGGSTIPVNITATMDRL